MDDKVLTNAFCAKNNINEDNFRCCFCKLSMSEECKLPETPALQPPRAERKRWFRPEKNEAKEREDNWYGYAGPKRDAQVKKREEQRKREDEERERELERKYAWLRM